MQNKVRIGSATMAVQMP